MRDYAELIKDLRESAEWSDRLAVLMGRDVGDSKAPLMRKAADAIEGLLDELTTIRKQLPHWISVEDELPSRYETVLLNIQTCKDSYVTIGDYEPNELRFRDFADRNNQVYCGDIVTHWMPLPAPPKGVE